MKKSENMRAVHNTILLTISNGVFAFCQWAIILVLARSGGAEAVGQFTLAMAVCTPTFIFFNLGLRQLLVTDVSAQFRWKEYLLLRLMSLALGLLFLILPIYMLGYESSTALIIFAVAMSKVIDALTELYYASYQKSGRYHRIAASRITRGLLGAAAFAICMLYYNNVMVASIAMAVAWFLVWSFLDKGVNPHNEKIEPDPKRLFALTKLAIPLAFSATFVSLKSTVPRIILEKSSGASELGMFSSYYYIVFILSLVVTSNSQVLLTKLSVLAASNKYKEFVKRLSLSLAAVIAIGALGIIVSIVFGEKISYLFYGKLLPSDNKLLIHVMIMGAISYISSPIAAGLDALRQFRRRLLIEMISTLVCVLSAYYLIPHMHGEGAAIAISIGLLCQTLMCAYFVLRSVANMRSSVNNV